MSTLYEITNEYLQLLEMAEDPDIDKQALTDTLEGISGEFEIKADGCARVIRELKYRVVGYKAEMDRMKKMVTACENGIDRIEDALTSAMIATGKKKFKTDLFNFSIQKNPASVVIDSEEIPDEFLIPQPSKIDKMAIKNRLKAGDKFTFAHLEQKEGLRIK